MKKVTWYEYEMENNNALMDMNETEKLYVSGSRGGCGAASGGDPAGYAFCRGIEKAIEEMVKAALLALAAKKAKRS